MENTLMDNDIIEEDQKNNSGTSTTKSPVVDEINSTNSSDYYDAHEFTTEGSQESKNDSFGSAQDGEGETETSGVHDDLRHAQSWNVSKGYNLSSFGGNGDCLEELELGCIENKTSIITTTTNLEQDGKYLSMYGKHQEAKFQPSFSADDQHYSDVDKDLPSYISAAYPQQVMDDSNMTDFGNKVSSQEPEKSSKEVFMIERTEHSTSIQAEVEEIVYKGCSDSDSDGYPVVGEDVLEAGLLKARAQVNKNKTDVIALEELVRSTSLNELDFAESSKQLDKLEESVASCSKDIQRLQQEAVRYIMTNEPETLESQKCPLVCDDGYGNEGDGLVVYRAAKSDDDDDDDQWEDYETVAEETSVDSFPPFNIKSKSDGSDPDDEDDASLTLHRSNGLIDLRRSDEELIITKSPSNMSCSFFVGFEQDHGHAHRRQNSVTVSTEFSEVYRNFKFDKTETTEDSTCGIPENYSKIEIQLLANAMGKGDTFSNSDDANVKKQLEIDDGEDTMTGQLRDQEKDDKLQLCHDEVEPETEEERQLLMALDKHGWLVNEEPLPTKPLEGDAMGTPEMSKQTVRDDLKVEEQEEEELEENKTVKANGKHSRLGKFCARLSHFMGTVLRKKEQQEKDAKKDECQEEPLEKSGDCDCGDDEQLPCSSKEVVQTQTPHTLEDQLHTNV